MLCGMLEIQIVNIFLPNLLLWYFSELELLLDIYLVKHGNYFVRSLRIDAVLSTLQTEGRREILYTENKTWNMKGDYLINAHSHWES